VTPVVPELCAVPREGANDAGSEEPRCGRPPCGWEAGKGRAQPRKCQRGACPAAVRK